MIVYSSGFKQSIFSGGTGGLTQVLGNPRATLIEWSRAEKTGTVKINNYRFESSIGGYDNYAIANCEWTSPNNNCYIKMDAYKDDQKIFSKTFCNGEQKTIDGITIDALHLQYGEWYSCSFATTLYSIKVPDNAINISVATPQAQYFEGQDVKVDVIINNGWMPVAARIDTTFQVPTTVGYASNTESQSVSLKSGKNRFSYTIPAGKTTEKILVTPKVTVTMPISSFSGLNTERNFKIDSQWISGNVPISKDYTGSSDWNPQVVKDYELGSVTEKTFEVMIMPKPLYLSPNTDGSCLAGYSINSVGNYCVRDDIKALTCYQTGCPQVQGHDYSCTSAGICAETVYKTVWGDCPDGTTNTTTDTGEQICIKTEIAEKFLECSTSSIKPTVCSGITASCVNNKWVFSGACDVITETQIKEKIVEVPVIKEVTNTITIEKMPKWVYLALAGGVLAIVALMLKKKRR